jgi:ribosomal-protein-alanine N-acetyltransferase
MGLPSLYKIRKFKEEELEKVISINLSCLPENYSSFFFLELYRSFPETFIVAEFQGQIIGYVMCRIESGFSEANKLRLAKKGHVVSFAVLPEHRNKGVGSALMKAAIKGMETYSCTEAYLEVRKSNKSAINLYEKLGFKIIKNISNYYMDGEDACLMYRKLPFERNQQGNPE